MNTNVIQLDPELAADMEAIEAEVIAVEEDDDRLPTISYDQVLAGHGLVRDDQTARTFVKGKAIHRAPEVIVAEREARAREVERRKKQRQRQAAKRTKIAEQAEAKPVDEARMGTILTLLGNLTHVIANLTLARYNRYRRVLGDTMIDDIAQDATIRIAEALSKSTTELLDLAYATMWLKDAPQPYDSADGPKGSGRLLGTMVTVIRRTIVDTYRANTTTAWVQTLDNTGKLIYEAKDVTVASLELLETVDYNTRNDVDDFLSHSKGDRSPAHESSAPGMRDKRLFARMIVDAAINARGLDWLATMLLNPENVRTDDAFKWSENAERIWAGLGLPPIMTENRRVMAEYAKRATKIAFQFLPDVITAAYDLVNDPEVMWHLNVTGAQEIVEAAVRYRPMNYANAQTYNKGDSMDGGTSLARSVELMDDPDAVRQALDMIYHEEA